MTGRTTSCLLGGVEKSSESSASLEVSMSSSEPLFWFGGDEGMEVERIVAISCTLNNLVRMRNFSKGFIRVEGL